jgi:Glutathione S-transferase, N-terminal domain
VKIHGLRSLGPVRAACGAQPRSIPRRRASVRFKFGELLDPSVPLCERSSFRPLWAFEEIGLPYELKMMAFPPRALDRAFLSVNPLGTVPALKP